MPGRKRTKEELESIRVRILAICKKDPELTRRVVAERVGCSHDHVIQVLKEAKCYDARQPGTLGGTL